MRVSPTFPRLVGLAALLTAIALPLSARTSGDTGPETVTISGLSHWFGPAEFSHADHVDYAESCLQCHHHADGPDDINTCDSCHGEVFDPGDPETPPLLMAYHQRCIGCHRSEESGPVACVDCHERKALPDGPELGEGRVPE